MTLTTYIQTPWNWFYLSSILPLVDIEKHCKIWFAAKIIQKHWLRAYYDPERSVCRKRLMREFVCLCE